MSQSMIPYAHQDIDETDIQAVVDVLRGDWITQGPTVPAFENAVAEKCGVRHTIAVNSATSALHIACLALEIGPGSLVWTTPNTFVASANCALYCGAKIDFADIDPDTWCMNVDQVAAKITPRTKAIMPVHIYGHVADMTPLNKLAQQHGLAIIEDAAEAHGG